MAKQKHPGGRPSSYTTEMGDRVCAELARGRGLHAICKEPWAPCADAVRNWVAKFPEFAEKYARAREAQADYYAEMITEAAMAARVELPTGGTDSGEVAHRRLRVDALKWAAAKLRPGTYGERITQEVVGSGGGPVVIASSVTTAALNARIAALESQDGDDPHQNGIPQRAPNPTAVAGVNGVDAPKQPLTNSHKPAKRGQER